MSTLTPHPAQLRAWKIPGRRYLAWGFAASVTAHAALLAWQRQTPPTPDTSLPALEVILVNTETDSAPVRPSAIAPRNMEGGGDARVGVATSPVPFNGKSADSILLEAMARKRLQLEAEQQQLLTQLKSLQEVAPANPTPHFLREATTEGHDPVDQERVMLNARMTALASQVEQYNQRPRKYFDAPGAAQSRYAAYLDQWRSRIETTGTEHYPRGAGPQVYGTLRASVTVRADGTVIDVTIDQPSNEPLLNLAVRRIVSLAAPFAPFPPDIARQVDQIVITRTWHFVNGALQTRQP